MTMEPSIPLPLISAYSSSSYSSYSLYSLYSSYFSYSSYSSYSESSSLYSFSSLASESSSFTRRPSTPSPPPWPQTPTLLLKKQTPWPPTCTPLPPLVLNPADLLLIGFPSLSSSLYSLTSDSSLASEFSLNLCPILLLAILSLGILFIVLPPCNPKWAGNIHQIVSPQNLFKISDLLLAQP